MKGALRFGLLAACLAAGPTFAQDSADSPPRGITLGDHAKASLHIMRVEPYDLVASKLIGAPVFNNQQDKVGEIKDFVFKDGQTIAGVVVSIGGVLGIGEKYVVIDPASIVVSERDGKMKAYVNASKDEMEFQTKFSYDKEEKNDKKP